MKGEWVHDVDRDVWHLARGFVRWDKPDDRIGTWCNLVLPLDAPQKTGAQLNGMADILHDECVRKSEELP